MTIPKNRKETRNFFVNDHLNFINFHYSYIQSPSFENYVQLQVILIFNFNEF